jgi:hypothetical protein
MASHCNGLLNRIQCLGVEGRKAQFPRIYTSEEASVRADLTGCAVTSTRWQQNHGFNLPQGWEPER